MGVGTCQPGIDPLQLTDLQSYNTFFLVLAYWHVAGQALIPQLLSSWWVKQLT